MRSNSTIALSIVAAEVWHLTPVRLVRKLGAHRVIDARRPDSIEQLRKFAPDGLHAVLALAGGDELGRCIGFVRPKGRVVYPNGIDPVPGERPTFQGRVLGRMVCRYVGRVGDQETGVRAMGQEGSGRALPSRPLVVATSRGLPFSA